MATDELILFIAVGMVVLVAIPSAIWFWKYIAEGGFYYKKYPMAKTFDELKDTGIKITDDDLYKIGTDPNYSQTKQDKHRQAHDFKVKKLREQNIGI